jgi:hypothetical protein
VRLVWAACSAPPRRVTPLAALRFALRVVVVAPRCWPRLDARRLPWSAACRARMRCLALPLPASNRAACAVLLSHRTGDVVFSPIAHARDWPGRHPMLRCRFSNDAFLYSRAVCRTEARAPKCHVYVCCRVPLGVSNFCAALCFVDLFVNYSQMPNVAVSNTKTPALVVTQCKKTVFPQAERLSHRTCQQSKPAVLRAAP